MVLKAFLRALCVLYGCEVCCGVMFAGDVVGFNPFATEPLETRNQCTSFSSERYTQSWGD